MRILISTPCAGGMATTGWIESVIKTVIELGNAGHDVAVKMQNKESLINRARNTDATYALTQGYDKCLFIDSDIIFTWEQVRLLLESKREIIGGTYPIKTFPVTVNFNPLPEQRDLFGRDRQAHNYAEWAKKYADRKGEAEVLHVPTGFLMVDTKVFAALTYKVPWYQSFDAPSKTTVQHYEFFPTGVVEHELESEDWGFCRVARENGFKVYLQTKAVTQHIGSWAFRLGQYEVIEGQDPRIGT